MSSSKQSKLHHCHGGYCELSKIEDVALSKLADFLRCVSCTKGKVGRKHGVLESPSSSIN